MSKYLLLIIPVILIVLFIGYESFPIEIGNVKITPSYDCAKNFDKLKLMLNEVRDGQLKPNYDPTQFTMKPLELYENRCMVTVKSWANESLFEDLIWAGDWQKASYSNQIYLGEVECPPNVGYNCEYIKTQRQVYQAYVDNTAD